jgi:hypothetical protein
MFLPMLAGSSRGCTLYKDTLTTYRRYHLKELHWWYRLERKESGSGERGDI